MSDTIVLGAEPSSVGQARRFASGLLEKWDADEAIKDLVTLLVSELVTNVVLHAGTTCELSLSRDRRLRVEVTDGSSAAPMRKRYDVDAASGRGMHLLEALSDRCGTEATPTGKRVWFEVAWHGAV